MTSAVAADHYRGLKSWVDGYKIARRHSPKIAKGLRDSIKKAILRHGLDAALVWGEDPDGPAVYGIKTEE